MNALRITTDDTGDRKLATRTIVFAAKLLLENGHPQVQVDERGMRHHGVLTYAGNGRITVDTHAGTQDIDVDDVVNFHAP